MEITEPKAISGQAGQVRDRFNSGKWLHIPPENEEMRTIREQVIILPPYSVHARAAGNCEIRFRLDGVQRSISAGTKNQRQAESVAKAVLARWLAAQGKTTAGKKTGLRGEIDAFVEVQYRDLKRATRDEAILILNRFEAAYPLPHVQDITPEVFRAGAGRFRGEASPKYWANILATVRRFSRALVDQGKIVQDFTKGTPMPKRSAFGRREVTWTEDELAAVLEVLTPLDRDALTVMRWTGLDSSDVFELRRKHLVKDETGAWVIKKQREKAKGPEETILQPIGSVVRQILMDRYKATRLPADRLFDADFLDARSFTSSLRDRVRRATASAGLPLKHLKALRHTFATYHAERGVPLDVLRRWMGHAPDSRVLDRIYVHRASTARYMD